MAALDQTVNSTKVSMTRLIKEADKALNDKLALLGDDLASAFAGAIAKGESLGETLQNLAEDIAYLIIKSLALRAISGIFGGLFGGTGIGMHSGGIVGEDAPSFVRSLPRFHSGGVVGADEHLAILQTGEGVFSRKQMQAMGEGLGGQNVNVTMNIQAIDAKGIKDFFSQNRGFVQEIAVQSVKKSGALRMAIRGA